MWSSFRKFSLLGSLLLALSAISAQAQDVMFKDPSTTIFVVDFRAAHKDPEEQERLLKFIEKHSLGALIFIQPVTINSSHDFAATDWADETKRAKLQKWIERTSSRARNRPATFERMNERFHDAIQDVMADSSVLGMPKKANIYILASRLTIDAGRETPLLSESDVEDSCIAEAQRDTRRPADLSEWSLSVVGFDLNGGQPADGLNRSIAAMIDATPQGAAGAKRVFFGFGNRSCPDEMPEPYDFSGLNNASQCNWSRAAAANAFTCPAPLVPTTTPTQQGSGGTTPTPTQPTNPVQTTSVPPQPLNPTSTSQAPQGNYAPAKADLTKIGNTAITSIVTEAVTGSSSNPAGASIARNVGFVRSTLLLAGAPSGNQIRTATINALPSGQRNLGLELAASNPCRVGSKISTSIVWSASGQRWQTTVRGYVINCGTSPATSISLGEF